MDLTEETNQMEFSSSMKEFFDLPSPEMKISSPLEWDNSRDSDGTVSQNANNTNEIQHFQTSEKLKNLMESIFQSSQINQTCHDETEEILEKLKIWANSSIVVPSMSFTSPLTGSDSDELSRSGGNTNFVMMDEFGPVNSMLNNDLPGVSLPVNVLNGSQSGGIFSSKPISSLVSHYDSSNGHYPIVTSQPSITTDYFSLDRPKNKSLERRTSTDNEKRKEINRNASKRQREKKKVKEQEMISLMEQLKKENDEMKRIIVSLGLSI